MSVTTLRSRCAALLSRLQSDAVLRQGSPVDDLVAFVTAETGRKADDRLDQSEALVLYFPTKEDREGFIAAFHEVKPHAISKKVP